MLFLGLRHNSGCYNALYIRALLATLKLANYRSIDPTLYIAEGYWVIYAPDSQKHPRYCNLIVSEPGLPLLCSRMVSRQTTRVRGVNILVTTSIFQEIFEKIDVYRQGSIFLRDVVEILVYNTCKPLDEKARRSHLYSYVVPLSLGRHTFQPMDHIWTLLDRS